MLLRPKPEIENLKACPHGGINYAEMRAAGLTPREVLDFSVCTNPFMPPPGIKKLLNNTIINQYPDSEATEFRQLLSERLGVPPDNILAGSGTTELIRLIALTYFRQDDSILILEPTYGDYEVACHIVGAKPVKLWGRAGDNFVPGIEEATRIIRQCRPRGVFICNPNNPTGKYFSQQEVERILDTIDDGILILDEAYITFIEANWPSMELISRGNAAILRSMTKDYGLAGLRLGYAIANTEIINSLRRVCPPWSVNALAQKAGVMALEAVDYLERTKRKIRKAKQFLIDELSRLGFKTLPSDANFFLVRVGNAGVFRTNLLKHGILVRDCTSFGLPEYIRLAPLTMPECQKLIGIVRSLKHEGE
ncbi:pyridoxal phosphate-dependent aminotransferase [Chloroflexota bacterium]